MQRLIFIATWSLVLAPLGRSTEAPALMLTAADLRRPGTTVTGLLGIPLGTVAEISANIVDGKSLKDRPDLVVTFLLEITAVNGERLKSTLIMPFTAPFRRVHLVTNYDELPGIQNRLDPSPRVSPAEMERLKKKYVGSHYNLLAYEEGYFDGRPDKLPAEVPIWSGPSFAFSSSLVVLAIKDEVGSEKEVAKP